MFSCCEAPLADLHCKRRHISSEIMIIMIMVPIRPNFLLGISRRSVRNVKKLSPMFMCPEELRCIVRLRFPDVNAGCDKEFATSDSKRVPFSGMTSRTSGGQLYHNHMMLANVPSHERKIVLKAL
jgi:hypothetical protein